MKKKYLYAAIAVLCWSTLAAVTKKLLADVPNMQALSISSFIAFLFLLIVNIKSGNVKKMKEYSKRDYGIMSGLGVLGLFAYSALYYFGLSVLTSQEACILNYLWPIMLLIFSCIILGERITAMKIVAMISSFVGIVLLSLGGEGGLSGNGKIIAGIACCIVAAACYGLFSVLNKKANFDQIISMMVMWLVAAVLSFVFGILTENWVKLGAVQLLGFLWLGIMVNALAYLLWALALNESENTASIANLAYLTPFLSLLVSAVLLKEPIRLRAVIALVFIIGGILLQYIVEKKKESKGL